jgi:uncharacterized NAD(P)/FAD-binding protein YdhS
MVRTESVRYNAQEGSLVRGGEGTFSHQQHVYVCATIGGSNGLGQVLRLSDDSNGFLESIAESPGADRLNMPDAAVVVGPFRELGDMARGEA